MTPARLRLTLVVAAVLLMEVVCRTGLISHLVLSSPSVAFLTMIKILASGKFLPDIASTLSAWGVAVSLAVLVGIATGLLLHRLSIHKTVDPWLTTWNAVPSYAFYPLFVFIFGLGVTSKMIIGFLCAIMVVVINTLHGLDRVPPVLVRTAHIYGRSTLIVRLRYAVPWIFTGFRLAVAWAFIGIIGAEFIASTRGLGHEIAFAYNNFDNPVMYALILFVLLFALGFNLLLGSFERQLYARACTA